MITRRAALKLTARAAVAAGIVTGSAPFGTAATGVAARSDQPASPIIPRHDRIHVTRFNQANPFDRCTFLAGDLTVDAAGRWTLGRLDANDLSGPPTLIIAGDAQTSALVLLDALFAPPTDRTPEEAAAEDAAETTA